MIQKYLWGDVAQVKESQKNRRRGFGLVAISGDTVAYVNLLTENEKTLNQTSVNGLYKLNLKTLEIRAGQSPGYPNFSFVLNGNSNPSDYLIVKDKAYFISPTPKNGRQVLRYDFGRKTTEILTDFERESQPFSIHKVGSKVLVFNYVEGFQDSSDFYLIDSLFAYPPKKVGRWEIGYFIQSVYNPYDDSRGPIASKGLIRDNRGNVYHLMDIPGNNNVYRSLKDNALENLNPWNAGVNPSRISILDKFGPDGRLKWSKRFLGSSSRLLDQNSFEMDGNGDLYISGKTGDYFQFSNSLFIYLNQPINYHIRLDSNGIEKSLILNRDFDVSFSASTQDGKGNIFLGIQASDRFQLLGQTISSTKPRAFQKFLSVHKVDQNQSRIWTRELDVAGFFTANVQFLKYSPNEELVFALISGESQTTIKREGFDRRMMKCRLFCLSAANGSVAWQRDIDNDRRIHLAGLNSLDATRLILAGDFAGKLTYNQRLVGEGDQENVRPFWIILSKNSGNFLTGTTLEKPGFEVLNFCTNDLFEIFLSTNGLRETGLPFRQRFTDYEKYSWTGQRKQGKSVEGQRFIWNQSQYGGKMLRLNGDTVLVLEYSPYSGLEGIAFSSGYNWNFQNAVLFPLRFDPKDDQTGENPIPEDQARIFPNPHNEEFYIQLPEFTDAERLELAVMNPLGQKLEVRMEKLRLDVFALRLPESSHGLFFLQYALPGKGEKKVIRILKK